MKVRQLTNPILSKAVLAEQPRRLVHMLSQVMVHQLFIVEKWVATRHDLDLLHGVFKLLRIVICFFLD